MAPHWPPDVSALLVAAGALEIVVGIGNSMNKVSLLIGILIVAAAAHDHKRRRTSLPLFGLATISLALAVLRLGTFRTTQNLLFVALLAEILLLACGMVLGIKAYRSSNRLE
ncbi:MAG: hypothetical protein HY556_03780 [Euryarchaeota archaeon]|nr:hypothetical protein [Euryarchaeota archaeon]